ncbi:MAG: hypothetical protein ROO76_10925 [Terriglobia bacterium]|nr:hypothetical protein [Terriglobia bacterium]
MENRCRPAGRFFCWILTGLFLFVAAAPSHAAHTTRVNDTIYRADGQPASGNLVISWPAFTTATGEAIAAGRMHLPIGPNGFVDVALVPNTGSTPVSYYTVIIKSDDGVSTTEYWTVPTSDSSTVAAVRSKVVPTSVAAQFVGRDYVDSAIASVAKDKSGMVGRLSVLDYGADPSAGFYFSVNMSSGSAAVTNVYYAGLNTASGVLSANSAKVGQRFCVSGAGPSGADLCGHVISNNNGWPATITLDVTASTTVSNRGAYWGNDSSAAFQSAINRCADPSYNILGGCEIDVPPGQYLLGTTVNFSIVSELRIGRETVKCPAGRGSTKLVWTGADRGDMLLAPAGSVPVEVSGCSFVSSDYLANTSYTGRRAAIAIHIKGGTQHRIIDSRFGDLYEGIRLTSTWNNLIDHNYFYGPYNAAIHNANEGVAPVNATTFSNNEFGFYHLHGILSDSAGQGGSNGNFYFGNDIEGTSSDTISDIDLNDNWGSFGPNRFETSGSTVSGYQALILRGTYNNVQVTFCGGGMTIAGTDNQITCSNVSSPINDTGGFNTYHADTTRSGGLSGGGALSATIFGGRRASSFIDAPGFKMLGINADNPRHTPAFSIGSAQSSGFAGFSRHPTLSYGAAVLPNAPANSTFNIGDQLLPIDPGYGPGGYRNNVAFWECIGGTNATCTFDGSTWGGTGALYRSYLFSKLHAESANVPASGTSAQGDLVWKTNPSGTNPLIGWSVTTGGTPGTFAPIYAIDPANPPAWGATTPAAGTFTNVSASNSIAAPAAQFSAPADLSTIAGGPAFWCKADAQNYGDGASVASCDDSAASPHNASSVGTAPVYKAGVTPTGKPVLRFSGSGYLQTAAFTLNQPSTVCGVYSRAAGYYGGALWDGRNLNSASHYFASATALGLYTNGDGTTNISGTVANDNKFHVVCSVINNPNSAVYVDGTQIASGASGSANMGGVTIGAAGSGIVKATADIAEVVVFPSALSVANRQAVENYLTQKYISGFVTVKNAAGTIVSQFDTNGKLSSSGAAVGFSNVAFSATPVFDGSAADTFKITLSGNVTSSTLVSAVAGQPLNFIVCQDATGSRTMSWPANVKGAMTVGSAASKCSAQSFIFDGTNAIATGSGVINQ